MNNRGLALILLLFATLLGSCGGGGGFASLSTDPGGGIGGSGVTSSGTVTGFGSVFVNGIEYATGEADIHVNGVRVAEESLGLGMVVTVRGSLNDDGATGVADSIVFDGAVRGPITRIDQGRDGETVLLEVLGLEVLLERSTVVFEGVTFSSLRLNDLIEVSGYAAGESQLHATRIERIADFVPDESEVERTGLVADLAGTQFMLGNLRVEFGGADVSSLPGGAVADGQRVIVSGTLSGTTIVARQIRLAEALSRDLPGNEALILQGTIAGLDERGRFSVRGLMVDASEATLELGDGALLNGLLVQVDGVWNGQLLLARTVSSLRAGITLAAPVESINAAQQTITVALFNTTRTVSLNAQTLIEDRTAQGDRLRLGSLSVGDYVVVEALTRGETTLALRVNRTSPADHVLRADVQGFVAGREITLLGLGVNTVGARFVDAENTALTAEAFFSRLAPGDTLRVIDRAAADGVADEIRLVAQPASP